MQRIEKKSANIRELYRIEGIEKGRIVVKGRSVSVFEIGALCLLENDKDIESTIKNAYLACLRSIDIDYQILVRTDKIDMEEYINDIVNKEDKLLSSELKLASKKYIDYMRNIWKTKQIYVTKYYFIASNLSNKEEEYIKEAFKSLEDLGLRVFKMQDKDKIYNLIQTCIY